MESTSNLSTVLIHDSNPLLAHFMDHRNGPNKSKNQQQNHEGKTVDNLLSEEKLDRSSPDLWPEQIPGVTEFLARSGSPILISSGSSRANGFNAEKPEPPEWLRDLDQDDINMLHGYGSLTSAALLEKVKELQDLAYQLGIEEAREITRGKFLDVLSDGRSSKNSKSSRSRLIR